MKRSYLYAALGIIILITALFALWLYDHKNLDPQLLRAIDAVNDIYAYTQIDTTEVDVSGRRLTIEGVYENDAPNHRYTSSATTSVLIPNEGGHAFNLTNISIGDDVYTRISTESSLLRLQMPLEDRWHHFTKENIPASLHNVVVIGPIMDHILLFQDKGSLLTPAGESETRNHDGVSYTVFPVQVATRDHAVGGTLATLLERIGSGTVRVWVSNQDSIDMITIENHDFRSTTTVTNRNSPRLVPPPLIE